MLELSDVSDAMVMDIIGHDSKTISRNYTHISDVSKAGAMVRLPDITKPEGEHTLRKKAMRWR